MKEVKIGFEDWKKLLHSTEPKDRYEVKNYGEDNFVLLNGILKDDMIVVSHLPRVEGDGSPSKTGAEIF